MREEKYQAAIDMHRHYDNLSLAVAAAQFGVTYGCYTLFANQSLNAKIHTWQILILGALAVIALYFLYLRCNWHARVARNVARLLEVDPNSPGVSEVISQAKAGNQGHLTQFAAPKWQVVFGRSQPSIKLLVLVFTVAQAASLAVSAWTSR